MSSFEPILRWSMGPDHPRWTATLRDETRVVIRPVRKEDAAAERAFVEALSPSAWQSCMLGRVGKTDSTPDRPLTDVDYEHTVAFAAVMAEGITDTFLGIGRYSVGSDGASCKCAVTVLDEWRGKGLGTVLMRHLIEVAQARGILYMFSVDAVENADIADLMKHLGFTRHVDPGNRGQAVHGLWLSPSAGGWR
ncbi:MAG: GNAT family N-acetyltransferase [Proteobacteria bacterium]|nr:GNAT family N-acetyltransferase [Pseudomonadota bacterium]